MRAPQLCDIRCNISDTVVDGINLIVSEIQSVADDIDIELNTVEDLKASQESIKHQLEEIIRQINY